MHGKQCNADAGGRATQPPMSRSIDPYQAWSVAALSFDASIAATFSCLGSRRILNGIGVLPDSPSHSSRQIGSSGRGRISKHQRKRETANQSSFSATCIPGQIRRLGRVSVVFMTARLESVNIPSTECPVVSRHHIGLVRRLHAGEIVT